jgi:DNA-binding transcriptional regulator YiaG
MGNTLARSSAMLTAIQHHLSGTELRSRRLSAGLSRQQLASMVGVDAAVVGDWEADDRPIEYEAAVRQALASARSLRAETRDEARWR